MNNEASFIFVRAFALHKQYKQNRCYYPMAFRWAELAVKRLYALNRPNMAKLVQTRWKMDTGK